MVSCNLLFRYKHSSKQAKELEHFSFLAVTVEYMTCSFTMSIFVFESVAAFVGAQLAEQLHPKMEIRQQSTLESSQPGTSYMTETRNS